ncbi:MAG: C-GCAxxG-C-C family protein [Erysipelotrichaceae bacterium]|nr:C-GCAxxG-C-C family protein [Erysipelotrichaceae bacterium]MBQ6493206.1 C-GCAxxG-C-C family protein [Erysipelotrichaceae bacterium]
MSEFLEKVRSYYQDEYYNCSEAIIHAANDHYGLKITEEDMLMFGGYGGGMYSGIVCGALVSSIAVISKMVVKQNARREKETVRPLIQKAVRNFNETLGGLSCKELKPKYWTKELSCWRTVELAATALEKTVEEIRSTTEE